MFINHSYLEMDPSSKTSYYQFLALKILIDEFHPQNELIANIQVFFQTPSIYLKKREFYWFVFNFVC